MFGISRQKILDESQWQPCNSQLAYIEAWRYPGTGEIVIYTSNAFFHESEAYNCFDCCNQALFHQTTTGKAICKTLK
jgi:hypothetical protein